MIGLIEQLARAIEGDPAGADLRVPVTEPPYAVHLGLEAQLTGESLVIVMPYKRALLGTPLPPRLHGGVVGGLLELTAGFGLMLEIARDGRTQEVMVPKPVNVTVEYLRGGAPADTFARATITRLGRRFANVRAEAWQSSESRLIASAHFNMLVAGD